MRLTLTTFLVVANVAAYVWQQSAYGGTDHDNGYLSPQRALQYGEWWRVFTAAFLHWGITHIVLNMIALYSVGNVVEELYGKVRFALIYVVAIVGSGLTIVEFSTYNSHTLGASGAIFGLFGALVAVGLRMGPRGRSLIQSVLPVLAINLLITFTIPGISAAGHVGGLIAGFLAGLVLFMVRRSDYAYAYAAAPAATAPVATLERAPKVETVEHPRE